MMQVTVLSFICCRSNSCSSIDGGTLSRIQWTSVCHQRHQGDSIPADIADVARGPAGGDLETVGICGLHTSTGKSFYVLFHEDDSF